MQDNEPQFESFLDAIDANDPVSAAQLLREKGVLSPDEVGALADLLDPVLDTGPFDLKQLVIKNRNMGAPPTDPLEARFKSYVLVGKIHKHRKIEGKIELAVSAAAAEMGVGTATAYKAWSLYKDVSLPNWMIS